MLAMKSKATWDGKVDNVRKGTVRDGSPLKQAPPYSPQYLGIVGSFLFAPINETVFNRIE